MTDLIMGILALVVFLLVLPAILLGLAFVAVIPILGIGVIGQFWSTEQEHRDAPTGTERLEALESWRRDQLSREEEVWRHTG